jgi:hypothetical protein
MTAGSSEVSEAPPIARPQDASNAKVYSDSAPRAGQGKADFQRIADNSQSMVQKGTLPDLRIGTPGQGSPPETTAAKGGAGKGDQSQEAQKKSPQDVQTKSPSGDAQSEQASRDNSRRNASDTANKIASGTNPQEALSQGIANMRKDNPNADLSRFGGDLNDSFRKNPQTQSLQSITTSDSVIVRDQNARTTDNPGGVVATASTAASDTAAGQSKAASTDTARKLLSVGKPTDLSSPDTYNQVLGNMSRSGELAGVPDLPPRSRPSNALSPEQQKSEVNQKMGGQVSDATLTSALSQADNLAFNTSGANLGAGFSQSVDSLAQSSGVDKATAAKLLTNSLNTVTRSNDFGLNQTTAGAGVDSQGNLKDKRLASPANPSGATDSVLLQQGTGADSAQVAGDFKSAQQAASIIKQGRSQLSPNMSQSDFQRYLGDSTADLSMLQFRSF